MAPIEDFIKSKTGDKTLQSHLIGIMSKSGFTGNDQSFRINKSVQAKLWGLYEEYTGKESHSEGTHGGKDITLSQFVTSAIESYEM